MKLLAERVKPEVGTGLSSSVLNEAGLVSEPRKVAMSCSASCFVKGTFSYLLETHNSMW